MTPEQRVLRAQAAAHTSWGNTTDRTARTAPARAGLEAKFDQMVIDRHGVLPPAEHAKRAASYRKAYYAQLALKSARTRAAKTGRA